MTNREDEILANISPAKDSEGRNSNDELFKLDNQNLNNSSSSNELNCLASSLINACSTPASASISISNNDEIDSSLNEHIVNYNNEPTNTTTTTTTTTDDVQPNEIEQSNEQGAVSELWSENPPSSASSGFSDDDSLANTEGDPKTIDQFVEMVKMRGRLGLIKEYAEIRARPPDGTFTNAR